jgi:16S rRNA (cytidine1402-2'-O)-methyltransferase
VGRHCVVARELTKLHETLKGGPVADLLAWVAADEDQRRGEFVVLLAGAEDAAQSEDVDGLLHILLEELPLKQAAALAARITGQKKNRIYQRALELAGR